MLSSLEVSSMKNWIFVRIDFQFSLLFRFFCVVNIFRANNNVHVDEIIVIRKRFIALLVEESTWKLIKLFFRSIEWIWWFYIWIFVPNGGKRIPRSRSYLNFLLYPIAIHSTLKIIHWKRNTSPKLA